MYAIMVHVKIHQNLKKKEKCIRFFKVYVNFYELKRQEKKRKRKA